MSVGIGGSSGGAMQFGGSAWDQRQQYLNNVVQQARASAPAQPRPVPNNEPTITPSANVGTLGVGINLLV